MDAAKQYKKLARSLAWRKFRFALISHICTYVVEAVAKRMNKEALMWAAYLEELKAVLPPEPEPVPEAPNEGWKNAKVIAEFLTEALHGQDLRPKGEK